MSLHKVAAVLVDSAYRAKESSFKGDREETIDHLRIVTAAYNDMLYYLSGSDPVRAKQASVGAHNEMVWAAVDRIFEDGTNDFSKTPPYIELKDRAGTILRSLSDNIKSMLMLNGQHEDSDVKYVKTRKTSLKEFSDNLRDLAFTCGQILRSMSDMGEKGEKPSEQFEVLRRRSQESLSKKASFDEFSDDEFSDLPDDVKKVYRYFENMDIYISELKERTERYTDEFVRNQVYLKKPCEEIQQKLSTILETEEEAYINMRKRKIREIGG